MIYKLRNRKDLKLPRADTKTKTLLAAKKTVDSYYECFANFLETRDRAILLNKLFELYKRVPPTPLWTKIPKGWALPEEGYVFTSEILHPLIVIWIAALEKIRHDKPLKETFTVTFNVDSYAACENTEGVINATRNGVTLEPSDCDRVTIMLPDDPAHAVR